MINKSLTTFTTCFFFIFLFSVTSVAGFGPQADDTEAKALGGANTARAKGASAVLYNPAGLVGDTKYNLRGSIYWKNHTLTIGSAESDDDSVLNGTLAISMNLNDRLAIGVGYLSAFENSLNMDRFDLITNSAFYTDISIDIIRPAIAYKLTDQFSVGVGIDYYDASLSFENYFEWATENIVDSTSFPISSTLSNLTDSTFGFSLGILGELGDGFSIGATYKHEVELELSGDAEFISDVYSINGSFQINEPALGGWVDPRSALMEQLPYSGQATLTMTLPSEISFGAYYKGNDTFSASADVRLTQWSSMADNEVKINNLETSAFSFGKSWDDTVSVHLGVEYSVMDKITLLAGFANMPSPINSDSVPQIYPYGDRQDYSIGTRFYFDTVHPETDEVVGSFSFDFAVVFSSFDDINSPDMSSNYPKLSAPFVSVLPGFSLHDASTEATTFFFGMAASFN